MPIGIVSIAKLGIPLVGSTAIVCTIESMKAWKIGDTLSRPHNSIIEYL